MSPQPNYLAQTHTLLAGANDNSYLYVVFNKNGTVLTVNRASGNMAVNWTNTYDTINSLTAELLSVNGGAKTFDMSYVYDASGTLVHVDETTDGKYTDYIGKIARVTNGGWTTWLHMDHLGSAQTGTDMWGQVAWREQYTPFGTTLTNPLSNNDQAGFTGHIKDSATGLTYMQARYYDPLIGRFLSIDPVGFSVGQPQMFNRFSYVGNDPVNATDPFGLSCRGTRIGSSGGSICGDSGGFWGQSSASSAKKGNKNSGQSSSQTSMSAMTACDMRKHCFAHDPAAQPDGSIHVGFSAGGATAFTKGATVNLPPAGSVGSHVGLVTLMAQDNSTPGPLTFTSSAIKDIAKEVGSYVAQIPLTGPGARIQIYANGKPFRDPYYISLDTYTHVQVPDHTPLSVNGGVKSGHVAA